MGAVNTFHALVVLSAVAVLYAAWMMYYFMRDDRRDKKGGKGGGASPPPERKSKRDVVGKSRYVLPARRHSQPLTAIESESEKGIGNEDIFAAESVPEHPRQIAPEELDDVFGAPPEWEANESLDLDYPLYESFPEEDADETDDEDEEENDENIPATGKSYAQGASYEELGEAYRRVVHDDLSMTDEQIEETGRILLNLKTTDMYGIIVSGKPEREDKVTALIDAYLAAFHKRTPQGSAQSQSVQGDIPPEFNVRDFA